MATRKSSKAGSAKAASQEEELSFEKSIQRLGEIVESLESGEQPLEESLQLFEEGMTLSKSSQKILDTAERRVEELLGVDEQGQPRVRPLDSE